MFVSPMINRLPAIGVLLVAQCFASLTNQYQDYRLYSVQMPSNYELVNNELLSTTTPPTTADQDGEPNKSAEQNANNLFYSLMSQLISHAPYIDFWTLTINRSLFTVPPQYYVQVEDYLLNNSLAFDLLDENIQNRLNQEQQEVALADVFNAKHLNPNSSFQLNTYHPIDEINEYLRYLSKRYPETVRMNSIGKTFENREIYSITIRRKSNLKRPNIIIDAGIHPREWIGPASSLVLISKLVYYFNMNASHTVLDALAFLHNTTEADLVVPIDWTIIPVLNPDGYMHTWIQDRLYRKNRAVPKAKPRRSPWSFFNECIGTDVNRNFDYYFARTAHSTNPCNDLFAGDYAFSEKESSALRTLVLAVRPEAYISLHSFSLLITWPNELNRDKLSNHDQLKEVASKMSKAMKELENKTYRYGQISQFNYGVIGDSVGWANYNGINLTYRIDLRDKGQLGYNVPRNEIISNGEELLKGLLVVADEVRRSFKKV